MLRINSAILVIVLLALTVETLESRKIDSRANSARRSTIQRRHKRQDPLDAMDAAPFVAQDSAQSCGGYGQPHCDGLGRTINETGFMLQTMQTSFRQNNAFFDGTPTLTDCIKHKLLVPDTTFLSRKGISAVASSHILLIHLAMIGLIPAPTVQLSYLLHAKYVFQMNGQSYLTSLAIRAVLIHHVSKSSLQRLGLFPLPSSALNDNVLQTLGYITATCNPTAIGFAAMHVGYIGNDGFGNLSCSSTEERSSEEGQYIQAGYLHPQTKIVTILGIIALAQKVISPVKLSSCGCFPFRFPTTSQPSDEGDISDEDRLSIISQLVTAQYLVAVSHYLTEGAYHAIQQRYFSTQQLYRLNLWPCRNPSFPSFIAAGYVTASGQPTNLGYSLSHAGYFSSNVFSGFGMGLAAPESLILNAIQSNDDSSAAYVGRYPGYGSSRRKFGAVRLASDGLLGDGTAEPEEEEDDTTTDAPVAK